jgi:hypothetical protein
MLEQTNNALRFVTFFSASKQGRTGLTVTVDVYSPAGSQIVTGGSASAIGGGLYSYVLSSSLVTAEGEYLAVFKTSDTTVDQQHLPSLWVVGRAGIEHLDAAVGSRAAPGAAMTLDLSQGVPSSNSPQTVGDSLNAARAQGFGKWVQNGLTLTLYAADGTTPVRVFALDSASAPTQRV